MHISSTTISIYGLFPRISQYESALYIQISKLCSASCTTCGLRIQNLQGFVCGWLGIYRLHDTIDTQKTNGQCCNRPAVVRYLKH